MTIRKPWAILTSALLVLATAACTAPGSTPAAPAGSGSSGSATGSITIGIKFDQPGLGLKEGGTYTGFDVEVAKYVAPGARLLREPDRLEGVPVRSARDTHRGRSAPADLRHLLDHRRSQATRVVRRSVLPCRAGSPRPCRRHVDHRPRIPQRQEALLGDRLDIGEEDQGHPGRECRPARAGHVLQVRDGPRRGHARRGDHGQRHPGRLRRAGPVQGGSSRSWARRSPPSGTALASRRATPPCAPRSTRPSPR